MSDEKQNCIPCIGGPTPGKWEPGEQLYLHVENDHGERFTYHRKSYVLYGNGVYAYVDPETSTEEAAQQAWEAYGEKILSISKDLSSGEIRTRLDDLARVQKISIYQ
ncbi:hypothetical protein [Gimesia algae]|uniref:Uncharacterized protein n=1 Tax=Gimesia algae TaxID=2527971 RepID=A0A517VMP7_9PLAN|nr:hypothetical protein [Gimesia algae]QDT94255.1 hypothetical protein Pan161_59500 [Gimesia algae]